MAAIVIFGAGDIAKIAHYYFTHDSEREVAAFCVDAEYKKADTFCGLPVVTSDEALVRFPPGKFELFVAMSYAKMNELRESRYLWAKEKGYRCPSYISSKASVLNDGRIGENCFILEDNTVQPFCEIGNNVTLWSGNHIGHDAVIEDHCFISSHVVISGHCRIGRNSFLGVNSTLRNGIKLGAYTLLGAGALLMEDAPERSVYANPPAERRKITSDKIKL